jgi:adenylate cyclase
MASRLEQLNKQFNSQLIISKEVYDQLEHFKGEVSFKEVQLKGREKPVEILTVT